MQGEEWAGRQEGGGEEETEKPGDVAVREKQNTTVTFSQTYRSQVEEERGRDRTRLPPARGVLVKCCLFLSTLVVELGNSVFFN